MLRTFSYRVKGNSSIGQLQLHARSVNIVWNFCNDTQKSALRWRKQWPSAYDFNRLTSGSNKELGLHSQTVQAVCEQYDSSRKRAKKPCIRYRGKKSLGWIPFKASNVKTAEGGFRYYGHTYKVWGKRVVEGRIVCGSFSEDAQGHWYINITCEIDNSEVLPAAGEVGIDLGLKSLATCSDGTTYGALQFLRASEQKLAKAQRARKKKQVTKIHAKIKNQRKDYLQKISTEIVSTNGFIVVGDVSSSKLVQTKMAKSVYDAGWSMFKRMLEYKAIAHRGFYVEVNESFTTQLCSECGSLSGPKGIAQLGIREWVCCDCGTQHNRDVNSAKNILARGRASLAEGASASVKPAEETPRLTSMPKRRNRNPAKPSVNQCPDAVLTRFAAYSIR